MGIQKSGVPFWVSYNNEVHAGALQEEPSHEPLSGSMFLFREVVIKSLCEVWGLGPHVEDLGCGM